MTDEEWAEVNLGNFKKRSAGNGLWLSLSRDKVADGALERVKDPDKINQKDANLCGPTCFIRTYIKDHPRFYVQAVMDLFETGRASLGGSLAVTPDRELMTYKLPATAGINQADWILLASLRNTTSWFFRFSSLSGTVSGATLPHELVRWFQTVGYQDVREETNLYFNKGVSNVKEAGELFDKGYKVCLLINSNMLEVGTQDDGSGIPDHWVVLTSSVTFQQRLVTQPAIRDCFRDYPGPRVCVTRPASTSLDPTGLVSLAVYTYGNSGYKIPQSGTLGTSSFLKNYYGYVACKY